MALPGGAGDLSQVDTAEVAGSEGVSAKDLAAQVLAAASGAETRPTPADESGVTHQGIMEETGSPQIVIDPEKTTEAAAETTEVTAETDTGTIPFAEIEASLAEAGVDLGVNAKDLPKELLPVYEKLVQAAVDLTQDALTKQLEASQAVQSVNRFSERLKTAPDKVLLALALNQPEVWKKVSQLVSDMETDPRVRTMIERDLESEARLMEAERKEAAMQEQYRRTKANQVIAATSRLAREHGVPFNMAEKMVAMAVTANQGDIELEQVTQIVADLAKDMGKQPPVKPVKTATPAKVAAAKAAPNQAVAGSQVATPAARPASTVSAGLKDGTSEREGGGGKFRDLIKSINSRIREI